MLMYVVWPPVVPQWDPAGKSVIPSTWFHCPEGMKNEDSEELTADFFCNLIWTAAGRSVGELVLDTVRSKLQDLKLLAEKLSAFANAECEKVAVTF